ncbi:hypothetical protein FB45DRAFT_874208 [Roridomyces roridus]|uniref:Uncharacterized protein n=1 Tax=Roridomyces roridus TaxID=1738132 RepID=A0AAD7B9A7_9AGAR|nr:hypothetical protein FB45DRAFT_874208 [Roridomyces roridus]
MDHKRLLAKFTDLQGVFCQDFCDRRGKSIQIEPDERKLKERLMVSHDVKPQTYNNRCSRNWRSETKNFTKTRRNVDLVQFLHFSSARRHQRHHYRQWLPLRGTQTPLATPLRGTQTPTATPLRGIQTPTATPLRGIQTPTTTRSAEDAREIRSAAKFKQTRQGKTILPYIFTWNVWRLSVTAEVVDLADCVVERQVVEDDGTLVEWEDVSKLVAYSRCVEYEVILRTSSLGAGETTRESPSRAWSVISSVRDNDERVAMTDVIRLMSERGRVYGSEELALTEEYTTRKTSRELGAQSRAWLSVARLFVSERVRSVGKCRHWEPQGEARITSQKIAARVLEWRAVVSLGNACNWEPPSSVREVGGMRVIEVAGNGCTE